jgi:hypothetical protein
VKDAERRGQHIVWPLTLDSLRHEAVRDGGPRDGVERLSGSDWARSTRQGGTPVADVGERRLRRIEIDDLRKNDISTGLAASMEVLFELVREVRAIDGINSGCSTGR